MLLHLPGLAAPTLNYQTVNYVHKKRTRRKKNRLALSTGPGVWMQLSVAFIPA